MVAFDDGVNAEYKLFSHDACMLTTSKSERRVFFECNPGSCGIYAMLSRPDECGAREIPSFLTAGGYALGRPTAFRRVMSLTACLSAFLFVSHCLPSFRYLSLYFPVYLSICP